MGHFINCLFMFQCGVVYARLLLDTASWQTIVATAVVSFVIGSALVVICAYAWRGFKASRS